MSLQTISSTIALINKDMSREAATYPIVEQARGGMAL